MKKVSLAIFVILILIGSVMVFIPSATACHNQSTTCSPSEKDITDDTSWAVTYEIDVYLTPGCGNTYWVGFLVSNAHPKWHRQLYKKDDPLKASIIGVGTPPDANHNNWNYWHSAGTGSVHYLAILEVSCDQYTPNGQQETITVDVYSCDSVPNDLEHRVVTTTTTVNIPNGIRMYHKIPFMATQYVQPNEWAQFDITIKDIGEAPGTILLSKDAMSSDCLEDDWDWELPNSAILPPNGTVDFTLKVKPPANAPDHDYAMFIVRGVNEADSNYYHTVPAKTIVEIPKPDLSVRDDEGTESIALLSEDPCDGETINISLDVYNLGDKEVSNFDVTFRLNDVGNEQFIGTVTVTDTLQPGNFINVQHPWKAIEGTHSLCVNLDENKKIPELDEDSNNEAGLLEEISPPKPKSIKLTMVVDPTTCMPGGDFTVSGKANYNKEYNSLPVKNANVKIKIKETGTQFTTQTNTAGVYEKVCTAPSDADTYSIEVSITDGTISASRIDYLTVALFQVTLLVSPSTVITGETFRVSGLVSDAAEGVPDADVSIKLFDINDVVIGETTTKTDTDGFYTKEITSPVVGVYSDFKVKVTAKKGDVTGVMESKLFVDIDTDSDGIGNEVDEDDDGDKYPDTLEDTYGYDPLDRNNVPLPVADAGSDQTVNEGDEVSLDGKKSYSPVDLPLTYSWDFGDDSEESTNGITTHKYNADGEYTVTLTVNDGYMTDSTAVLITVDDLGPTAKLTGPTTGQAGVELTFKADESTFIKDKITKYQWDWDSDGTFDEETTEAVVKHTWVKAGAYTITLQVTDIDGTTDDATLSVTITPAPSDIEDETGDSKKSVSRDNTAIYLGIVIAIIVVILLVLFFLLRKKKPSEATPMDQRVTGVDAQASRRPTTQFAEADIKPGLAPPGTVPPKQISAPVQQRPTLPPSQPQHTGYQTPPQEQRDWSWNFNE